MTDNSINNTVDYRKKDNYAPYTCYAAAFIVMCRNNPELKQAALAGDHGLLTKHIIENESSWKENELWLEKLNG